MIGFRSWPSVERAAHYRDQATKIREMAEREPLGRVRDSFLALAAQYEDLAKSLRYTSI